MLPSVTYTKTDSEIKGSLSKTEMPAPAAADLSGGEEALSASGVTSGTEIEALFVVSELASELTDIPGKTAQEISEIVGETPAENLNPIQPGPDAEIWLSTMLLQQQYQLQAREAAVASLPAGSDQSDAAFQPESSVGIPMQASSAMVKSTPLPTEIHAQDPIFSSDRKAVSPAIMANSTTTFTSASAADSGVAAPTPTIDTLSGIDGSQLLLNGSNSEGIQRSAQSQSQLNLQAPEAKWGEQLLHALRDNVQVQIQQKIQNATIRLDPPELGSLEIFLSHEAGRLHVHITASQADVARLIQHTSDRLRQELAGPQFTQVHVQTSADGQAGQQQSRERQRFLANDNILANEQPPEGSNRQRNDRHGDVLVSV